MYINPEQMNFMYTLIIVLVLMYLYYNRHLDCMLNPIEKLLSWSHYTLQRVLSPSEHYSPCSPNDCNKYRVRKDQMYVRNPFKWPWSGSDLPQYSVQFDEVNKTAKQIYKSRESWNSHPTLTCGN